MKPRAPLDLHDGPSQNPPMCRWNRAAPMRRRATACVREETMTRRDDGRVRCTLYVVWGDSPRRASQPFASCREKTRLPTRSPLRI